jgi:hypothetical protein
LRPLLRHTLPRLPWPVPRSLAAPPLRRVPASAGILGQGPMSAAPNCAPPAALLAVASRRAQGRGASRRAFVLQYREWLCEHVSMVLTTDAASGKCVGISCEVSIRGGLIRTYPLQSPLTPARLNPGPSFTVLRSSRPHRLSIRSVLYNPSRADALVFGQRRGSKRWASRKFSLPTNDAVQAVTSLDLGAEKWRNVILHTSRILNVHHGPIWTIRLALALVPS